MADRKYTFRESERVAIWTADDRTPVHYSDLEIDHIVPENTSDVKLLQLRSRLPSGFSVNSVENWATCHRGCNARKGDEPFEIQASLFYLEMAKKRAAKVQEMIEAFRHARENASSSAIWRSGWSKAI